MKNIVLVCMLMLFLPNAQSAEMAGVKLPDEVSLPGASAPLVLNGFGIRKKFFFKVYLASLYLPERLSNAQKIIDSDTPKRVQMDMLYSKVEKEKFIEGWNEGFAANQTADALAPLQARLNSFNEMFEDLVEGDQVQLDYLPSQGTIVRIKGVEKGVIPGRDFNQALLRIWLGDAPVTDSLKKALLGG